MTTYLVGAVAVFRKCCQCGEYFRPWTDRTERLCVQCRQHGLLRRVGQSSAIRTIVLTDAGRRALREAGL